MNVVFNTLLLKVLNLHFVFGVLHMVPMVAHIKICMGYKYIGYEYWGFPCFSSWKHSCRGWKSLNLPPDGMFLLGYCDYSTYEFNRCLIVSITPNHKLRPILPSLSLSLSLSSLSLLSVFSLFLSSPFLFISHFSFSLYSCHSSLFLMYFSLSSGTPTL